MTTKAQDLQAKIAAAKAVSADYNEIVKGAGSEPPAAGETPMRLVEYVELGKHEGEYEGKKKINNKVEMVFELIGKKHPPKEFDGVKYPVTIRVTENIGQGEKSQFRKLFAMMNYKGTATTMVEFLGEPFLGTVFHKKSADGKATYANLRDENGYRVGRPSREDLDTGEQVAVNVGPALTELKLFVWATADLDDWNALYVEGEYEERKDEKGNVTTPARSKNRRQELIRKALNWNECAVYDAVEAGGREVHIPEDDTPTPTGGASADPLEAM